MRRLPCAWPMEVRLYSNVLANFMARKTPEMLHSVAEPFCGSAEPIGRRMEG